MKRPRILIVEDEISIAEVLIAYCQREHYIAKHISDGNDVLAYIQKHPVDLILLDLMLPNVDGITICKEVQLSSKTPIIMITAKNEEIDKLLGLELGADDYICKPFSPREVMARVKAVLRRASTPQESTVIYADYILELDKYRVTLKGQELSLTAIEFRILALFISKPEHVFNREYIMKHIYSDDVSGSDRNIDTHVKNIRKKIGNISKESNPIQSVYGVGYRFV